MSSGTGSATSQNSGMDWKRGAMGKDKSRGCARGGRGAVLLTRRAGYAGDPSLRRKNGSVQDDAE
jgi:hypothetical protein